MALDVTDPHEIESLARQREQLRASGLRQDANVGVVRLCILTNPSTSES
jgi:hypothetical protein